MSPYIYFPPAGNPIRRLLTKVNGETVKKLNDVQINFGDPSSLSLFLFLPLRLDEQLCFNLLKKGNIIVTNIFSSDRNIFHLDVLWPFLVNIVNCNFVLL